MSANQEPLNTLPRVGITIGDPAGIGPEIVLKTITEENLRELCTPVVICDARSLRSEAEALGFDSRLISGLDLVDLENVPGEIIPGIESAETGKASAEYIEKAVDMVRVMRSARCSTARA